MKRILTFTLLLALFMPLSAQTQQNVPDYGLGSVCLHWAEKVIKNVPDGTLGMMLKRFNDEWPYTAVGDVMPIVGQKSSEKVLDDETELTVVNDVANGYVSIGDAGTDSQYMTACVWRRSNGHRLLAINLGSPTDPSVDFVCFYDYDQKTKTLTPEPDILTGRKAKVEDNQFSHLLPRKGKDMVVYEYEGWDCTSHIYKWDGMRPVYLKSVEGHVDAEGNKTDNEE